MPDDSSRPRNGAGAVNGHVDLSVAAERKWCCPDQSGGLIAEEFGVAHPRGVAARQRQNILLPLEEGIG
jgi:hypothetical protein